MYASHICVIYWKFSSVALHQLLFCANSYALYTRGSSIHFSFCFWSADQILCVFSLSFFIIIAHVLYIFFVPCADTKDTIQMKTKQRRHSNTAHMDKYAVHYTYVEMALRVDSFFFFFQFTESKRQKIRNNFR